MGGRGAAFSTPANAKWLNSAPSSQVPESMKEALGERGTSKSIGDAIVETNPFHSSTYREFSQNCQRVVVAYELRRRGYDVTAQPTYRGDTLARIAYVDQAKNIYAARWRGAFRSAKTENVSAPGNNALARETVMKNIEAKMQSYGSGSRAVIQILYRSGGGHVFNVENQGGRVVYIEAQSGKIKDMAKTMKSVRTDSVNIVRVDNLKLSDRVKDFVWQERRSRTK